MQNETQKNEQQDVQQKKEYKKSLQKHLVKCPFCGKDILDHFTECPFCKHEVKSDYYNPDKAKLASRKKIYLFFGVIITVVIVLFIVLELI